MSIVDISITGLALCRPVSAAQHPPYGQSQILLLHPPGHQLKITVQRDGTSVHVRKEPEYKMSITALGKTEPREVGFAPPYLNHLVNLVTSHRGHGTLTFKPRTSTNMKVSNLLIPSNMIYTTTQTTLEHELWVYKHKTGSVSTKVHSGVPRAKLWRDMEFSFNVPDNVSELNLNITSPFHEVHQLLHDGASHKIIFDNDCHGDFCGNDFGYYYEILEGKDAGYFVEIEEFPILPKVPKTPPIETEAACNPVIVDPAPDLGGW